MDLDKGYKLSRQSTDHAHWLTDLGLGFAAPVLQPTFTNTAAASHSSSYQSKMDPFTTVQQTKKPHRLLFRLSWCTLSLLILCLFTDGSKMILSVFSSFSVIVHHRFLNSYPEQPVLSDTWLSCICMKLCFHSSVVWFGTSHLSLDCVSSAGYEDRCSGSAAVQHRNKLIVKEHNTQDENLSVCSPSLCGSCFVSVF